MNCEVQAARARIRVRTRPQRLGDIGSAVSPRTRKFLRIYVLLRTRPQSAHLWSTARFTPVGHVTYAGAAKARSIQVTKVLILPELYTLLLNRYDTAAFSTPWVEQFS